MLAYLEPFIIYLIGVILSYPKEVSSLWIVEMLLGFVITSMLLLVKKEYAVGALAAFAMVMLPRLTFGIFLLPAMTYPLFYRKNYWQLSLLGLAFGGMMIRDRSIVSVYMIALTALTLYMSWRCREQEELEKQNIKLRDDAVERERYLQEQNIELLHNQNDEIYIATLKERNRIAREIHDNVGHMLSRSILQVGALQAICKDDAMKTVLQPLGDTLNEAMNNIRQSVHDLHDESIDLQQSLQSLCEEFQFCEINLEYSCDRWMDKNLKYGFIAIVKEGLNNIMKHSNATLVHITMKEHPAFYQLLIEDNGTTSKGRNFDPNEEGLGGIGLSNINDRVKSLGGILKIQTEGGFRLFISVPKQNR